ncbi:MAG: hypothetical protein M3Q56_01720, partial [Bacteroidota bacterium]|nr:hypothetical protein [Bacteroidota bacterium]
NRSRICKPCGIRPSNVRVYQFHHPGIKATKINNSGVLRPSDLRPTIENHIKLLFNVLVCVFQLININ